jgi:hypothetical protein
MSIVRRVGCFGCLALVVAVMASRAGAAGRPQLAVWDAYSNASGMPSLHSKTTYATHALPVGLRITPVGHWKGSQWGSNRQQQQPATFGCVALGRKGVLVLVMAGGIAAPDPSATIARLRPPGVAPDGGSSRSGIYEATQRIGPGVHSPVFDLPALARYPGYFFDADLRWPDRLYPPSGNPPTTFVPFSPRTTKPASAPDRINVRETARSLGFTPRTARFIVLDVHGHTVVILIATEASTVEKTPYVSLLAEVRPTLNSITFGNH